MRPKLEGAALAPLVYWLLIVSGLAGITVLRFSSYGSFVTSDDIVALWAGSVFGVGLGQGAAASRVRIWVPIVIAMFGFWFLLPILFLVVDGIFGATAQTFCLAFLPAMVCGYLSLTERGALLSFWYPAVLWMIVILDGPTPGVFDERFALPFVVGLGALFIVYLRARQTRRVAIWKAHASERLADALPRTVLRASPIRSAAQHVFSAMAGACALVLTAWIAPHLWQTVKDPSRAPSSSAASSAYASRSSNHSKYGKPCCRAGMKRRERVKEYFPLQHAHDLDEDDSYDYDGAQCRVCKGTEGSSIALTGGNGKWSYGGTPGSGLVGDVGNDPFGTTAPWGYGSTYGSYGTTTSPSTTTATTTTTDTSTSTDDPAPVVEPLMGGGKTSPLDAPPKPEAPSPVVEPKTKTPALSHTAPATGTTVAPTTETYGAASVPVAPPRATSMSFPSPWRSSLAFCTLAFGFILFTRALRRALTLRHLMHPFWSESFDQRISNHWERMLIGLRDAGLEPGESEQPLAFARRIGIEGMEACATILERVRHGVRVDSGDLASMGAATDTVFRAARERAGVVGRATAWLRPPTA